MFLDDHAKGIIKLYIANLTSLTPNADDKMAHELLKTLKKEFDQKHDLLKVVTMQKLQGYLYQELETLNEYLQNL